MGLASASFSHGGRGLSFDVHASRTLVRRPRNGNGSSRWLFYYRFTGFLPLPCEGRVGDNGAKRNQEVIAMSIFPTRILLATDGSRNVAPATDVAVPLSKVTGSELHLVYVGEDAYSATLIYPETTDPGGVEREDPVLLEQLQRQFEQMSRRVLETEVEKVREAEGTVAQIHLRTGKAAAEIVDLAEELGAGLVVVGSRGLGGIRRALMGSVSDSVVRHAHCPVLVVRREEE